jgi:hypothetical protein
VRPGAVRFTRTFDLPEQDPIVTDYIRDPNDLPGLWDSSDFEGGDPDERSYAQREEDREPLNYSEDKFGRFEIADLRPIQDAINRDIIRLAAISVGFIEEPIGYDGFGAPIYDHQVSVEWGEPKTITVEAIEVSLETMALACGVDVDRLRLPLAMHRVDHKGTE